MDVQSIIPLSIGVTGGILIAVMIVLVAISSLFSMSETAFSSTTDAKLRLLIEERKGGAKKALQLASNFDKTLITLLIGNNIVNVLLSTLAVLFFGYLIQDNDTLLSVVSTAVVTITILIFGEILPKVIANFIAINLFNDDLRQCSGCLKWNLQAGVIAVCIERGQKMGHLALINLPHSGVVVVVLRTRVGGVSQAVAEFYKRCIGSLSDALVIFLASPLGSCSSFFVG